MKKSSAPQLTGVVLYDLGKTNPPSILRVWGQKALIVVAGDKIFLRTLTSDQNFGTIDERGVKVAFVDSASGNLWLAFKEPTIRVYDLNKPAQPQHSITSHSEWVAAVEVCEPGVVATASADKSIRIWKLPSLKSSVCSGHLDFVTCLAVVQNEDDSGYLLASGSCDKSIRLWDTKIVVRRGTMGCCFLSFVCFIFFSKRIERKDLFLASPLCTVTLDGFGQFVPTEKLPFGAVDVTARCETGTAKQESVSRSSNWKRV